MAGQGGDTVLLLKSESEGPDPYTSLLAREGFQVTLAPTLTFHYVAGPHLVASLASPSSYSCLVLTSPRAARAIARAHPGR